MEGFIFSSSMLFESVVTIKPGIVVEWFFKEDNDAGVYVCPNIRIFQRVFWAFRPGIEALSFVNLLSRLMVHACVESIVIPY